MWFGEPNQSFDNSGGDLAFSIEFLLKADRQILLYGTFGTVPEAVPTSVPTHFGPCPLRTQFLGPKWVW